VRNYIKKKLINNFTISNYIGGLGNNLQQIALGCMYANLYDKNFYIKRHPMVNNFSVINNRFSNVFNDYRYSSQFYNFDSGVDLFLKNPDEDYPLKRIDQKYYNSNFYNIFQKYIEPNIFKNDDYEFDRDTLVIHIRSGDIFFEDKPHPYYLQNPLVYYKNLIEQYKKTIIISAKPFNNPVISELIDQKNVEIISSDIRTDFTLLMGAHNLATSGVGTFAIAAALASKKLKNFHYSNIFFTHHLNPTMVKNVVHNQYRFNNYIELGTKWINSVDQKNIMLSKKVQIEKI